jgi:hypothetical protein
VRRNLEVEFHSAILIVLRAVATEVQ